MGKLACIAADADGIKLPKGLVEEAAWLEEQFPGADITDLNTFARIQSQIRKMYPQQLRGKDRRAYGEKLKQLEALQEKLVEGRAVRGKMAFRGKRADGTDFQLIGFEDGQPVYSEPENDDAAESPAASYVRTQSSFDSIFGTGINGSGFQANVNDHGTIYLHAEFEDRVTVMEVNDGGSRSHMTHVAGTIGAAGLVPRAEGMAPEVHMLSFIQQSNSDIVNYGMTYPGEPGKSIVGNTSLGSPVTAGGGGAYSGSDQAFD
ncbi:MAG: hypothetical protein AAF492_28685, partial [Verrucomicrobiota bacterium]